MFKQAGLLIKFVAPTLLLTVVAVVIAWHGLVDLRRTEAGLESVYHDRVIPLQQLKTVADDYAVLIIDTVNKANAGLISSEEALARVEKADARIREQ